MRPHLLRLLTAVVAAALPSAAESPYFVTYTHQMEEPGNLEIGLNQTAGSPKGGEAFLNSLLEFEYGVKTWWTMELYASGQGTRGDGALFTGYRIENRFRPLMGEHAINPVLYFEFAGGNGGDKSLKEVVGHDTFADQLEPNSETRRERKREVETKLILSSNVRGWNVAENLIAEKELTAEPWELGYAFGVSRPLAMAATPDPCRVCRENFRLGVEVFGGVGTWDRFGLAATSHYIAPIVSWELPSGAVLRVSPAFGLNGNSNRTLLRFGIGYEVEQFGRKMARVFRGAQR